jgi:hypothetical protein
VAEKIARSFLNHFAKDIPSKPEKSGLLPNQQPAAFQERMKVITSEL